MIYTATELIDRAMSLSDTSNSDFLTMGEKLRYLNDAYTQLYQYAIDRGDTFFLKRMEVGPGIYSLPKDFYAIHTIRGRNGLVLKRKNASDGDNEPGYRFMNNKLYIEGQGDLILEYFPLPKFITLSGKEKEVNIENVNTAIYSVYGDYIAYLSEGLIYIHNFENDETFTYEPDIPVDSIYLGSTVILEAGESQYVELNLKGEEIQRAVGPHTVIRLPSGIVTLADTISDTEFIFRGNTYTVESPILHRYVVFWNGDIYYTDFQNRLIMQNREDEGVIIDENCTGYNIIPVDFNKQHGILYSKNYTPHLFTGREIEPIDLDFHTWAGYCPDLLYSDGNSYYRKSWLPETELNYPSASFFSALAYMIAVYILAKQGADIEYVNGQKEQALNNYLDSLTDQNAYPRIKRTV